MGQRGWPREMAVRWGYWGRGPRGTCSGGPGKVGYGETAKELIVPEREAGGQR